MTYPTIEGILYLYDHIKNSNQNSFLLERYERALDEFTRNPDRISSARNLVKSSLGSAKKVLDNRKKYQNPIYNDEQYNYYMDSSDNVSEIGFRDIENIEFIRSSVSNHVYADILVMLYEGYTAEDISREKGISQKHANTLISRARSYARKNIKVVA